MTKSTVIAVDPFWTEAWDSIIDCDIVRLDCGHAAILEPHEDDNLSLVGTETECPEKHTWSPE